MTTTTKTHRPLEVFALDGELDRANLESLRAQFECRLERSCSLLLDMTAVTYVDGAFLSLLMDVLYRLGEAGFLGVAGPHKRIQQLFAIIGLGDLHGSKCIRRSRKLWRPRPTPRGPSTRAEGERSWV